MVIQLNTDNHAHFGEESRERYAALVTDELSVHKEHLRRVEIYLKDENAGKQAADDKRCLMEAHYAGADPVVATANADNYELAIEGALEKLKSNLNKLKEKLTDH
jgi:ribosome-associated translation inhibitor RaiA